MIEGEGADLDFVEEICIDQDDNIYVVGREVLVSTYWAWRIRKFDSAGLEDLGWEKLWIGEGTGTESEDVPFGCAITPQGDLIVVGITKAEFNVNDTNIFTFGGNMIIKKFSKGL